MVKILTLCLFLSTLAHAYLSDSGPSLRRDDSLYSISQELFNQQTSCIKSMVNAPHSPLFAKNYFQTLLKSDVLTIKSENLDTKDSFKFVFISDKEVLLLDLPKYYSKDLQANGKVQTKEYPGEVIHFVHQGREYYLDLEGKDMGLIKNMSDLPEISGKLKMNKDKILYDVIGKFEAYLKSRNLFYRTHLREANDNERDKVISCLKTKQENFLSIYLQSDVHAKLPGVDQMQKLLANKNLNQVPRERYMQPWDELEFQFKNDFYRLNPNCLGVINQPTLAQSLRSNLSLHRNLYVQIRQELEKEEALVVGRAED